MPRNYQEILHILKPSVVLEFGSRFGGSALYFSDVMKSVHSKGTPYRILTVDIDKSDIDPQALPRSNPRASSGCLAGPEGAVGPWVT